MQIATIPQVPQVAAYRQVVVEAAGVTTMYEAVASVGAAAASAVWSAWKTVITVSGSTTTVTRTWADGNAAYDNVATNLTSLSYS
jgi:hypothetical protein